MLAADARTRESAKSLATRTGIHSRSAAAIRCPARLTSLMSWERAASAASRAIAIARIVR